MKNTFCSDVCLRRYSRIADDAVDVYSNRLCKRNELFAYALRYLKKSSYKKKERKVFLGESAIDSATRILEEHA